MPAPQRTGPGSGRPAPAPPAVRGTSTVRVATAPGGDAPPRRREHDPDTAATVSPFLLAEPGAVSRRIEALGVLRRYRPGDHVYRQGEVSSWFHVVVSGRVRVSLVRPDGGERVLSYAEPGASLGEGGCFDGRPRYVSAVVTAATAASDILAISRGAVVDAAREDPEILLEVARRIGYKQRILHLHVTLDGLPARERVVLLLGHLVEAYGEHAPDDATTRLSIRPAVDELALMIGLTRVTTSRELSRLVAEGVLVKDGRSIVVQDPAALQRRVTAVAV